MKKSILFFCTLFSATSYPADCKITMTEVGNGFDVCLLKSQLDARRLCANELKIKFGDKAFNDCQKEAQPMVSRVIETEKKRYPQQESMFLKNSDNDVSGADLDVSGDSIALANEEAESNKAMMETAMVGLSKGIPNTDMEPECVQYVPVWKKKKLVCTQKLREEMQLIAQGKLAAENTCNYKVEQEFKGSPVSKKCPNLMQGIVLRVEK